MGLESSGDRQAILSDAAWRGNRSLVKPPEAPPAAGLALLWAARPRRPGVGLPPASGGPAGPPSAPAPGWRRPPPRTSSPAAPPAPASPGAATGPSPPRSPPAGRPTSASAPSSGPPATADGAP